MIYDEGVSQQKAIGAENIREGVAQEKPENKCFAGEHSSPVDYQR